MFALSHHKVVWWCAEQVYPGRLFDRYGILGDDIVIADTKVAEKYKEVLEHLQVFISKVLDVGAAEFSKRFLVKGLSNQ